MPIIPHGEWLPDQAAYQNPGVTVATNVLPSASGYVPMPTLVADTTALTARPRGAIAGRSTAGVATQYAGDETKLYQNASGTWTDRSPSGLVATGAGERWEFVQWKNKILATNFSDVPQQITFGDMAFEDLTTDFQSRHIAVIGDFVVHGNTFDGTDGNVPSRLRWSAFNDETDYTVSASTLSDFRDLKTAAIERVLGGSFGVILQGNSTWRMDFAGAPTAFETAEVLPGIGTIAPGAAVRFGDNVYFLSERGFIALLAGTQATPIGANKVDRTILADLDTGNLDRISAIADPTGQRVLWAYPGQGNVGGRPNKIAVFDTTLGRWSAIELDVELLWRASGTATDLEDLDDVQASIDDLSSSLDSKIWQGGVAQFAAFDSDFKSGFFSGPAMAATIETKEFEIHAGHRTRLNAFRPLVEGGTVKAQIGARDRQSDAVSFGPVLTQSASGRFTKRSNARYHRFRFSLTGDWTQAIGAQIVPKEAPRGERRG